MTGETTAPALVLAATDGATRTLTLHRPDRLNAVSEPLYHQLIARLREAAADRSVRVVTLCGAGRAFCAGADLKAHAGSDRTPAQRRQYAELAADAVRAVTGLTKPVIAQVHGYAFGAGAELAIAADFLLVADDAVLALPELTLGTYVGGGVSLRLPQLVGLARARELLFTGRRFTGAEAAQWGLAHRAAPAGQLAAATAELAGQLAAAAPVPVALLKRQLAGAELDRVLAAEVAALVRCMETADWREGAAAFGQRRSPRYEGR